MNTPDFDEATHTYTVDGVVYPSVTQILDEAGLIDARWWKPADAERGQRIHAITALYDKGELDESKVPDDLRGYLESWKHVVGRPTAFDMPPRCVEVRLIHPIHRFAGTLDRLRFGDFGLIDDIKTGTPQKWHALQIAGYISLAASAGEFLSVHGRGIYLDREGKPPQIVRHSEPDDRNAFIAALSVYNWKLKNGLLRKGDDGNDGTSNS